MSDEIRQSLSVIIAVTLIAIITGTIAFMQIYSNASSLDSNMFNWLIIVIPCVIDLVGSFAIMAMAQVIGKKLYMTVVVIFMVLGAITMFVSSSWMSDPAFAAQLLANSPEGTIILPVLQAPITLIRDVLAFFVCATVGCIAGAWVGSRMHSMKAVKQPKKKGKKR